MLERRCTHVCLSDIIRLYDSWILSASLVASLRTSSSFTSRAAASHNSSVRQVFEGLTTKRSMSSEIDKAQAAASQADSGAPTIFDKIIAGDIPSNRVFEDDRALAFRDVNPQAPVHVLVIPKQRDGLTQLSKAREDQKGILGHLMHVASEVGKKECPQGFRIVINDGEHGAQSVYHLHVHVLGGRQMNWPPG